ncbi:MAG: hypothetical protein A2Y25_06675 [Candidatus Melainabacteria bacterium GWF2_37_15]|nr:MAG: hypothetical protein A2Y25_06675 [Candidatus Melainabacteria bacterium GWF2_37_15]
MVTSQLLDLIKTDYKPKQEDFTSKYCSKESSDSFTKVFETAKKTQEYGQEYNYENVLANVNTPAPYENRETNEYKATETLPQSHNKTEETGKSAEVRNDNVQSPQDKEVKAESNKQEISDTVEEPKNSTEKASDTSEIAENKPKDDDQKIQNNNAKAEIKEPATDTAGKLLLENAAAKITAKDIKLEVKDVKAEAKAETKDIKADAKEAKADIKADVKAEVKAEIKDIKADAKSEIKPEVKSEVRAEIKAEIKEVKAEAKSEMKAEVKDVKAEVKSEAKAEIKDIKADAKEAKADIKAEVKAGTEPKAPVLEASNNEKPENTKVVENSKTAPPPSSKILEKNDDLKVDQVKVSHNAEPEKQAKEINLNLTMDQNKQGQSKPEHEIKANTNLNQSNNAETGGLKLDLSKTAQFDRILNSRQSDLTQQSVLNQVKQASAQLSNGKSEVSIALNPENLGRINLNLVSSKGVLTAQVIAENQQVKEMLSKGIETLRQNLAEQGINVGRIVVNVQEPSSENNNSNFDQMMNKFDHNNGSSQTNAQSGKQNNSGNAHIETNLADINTADQFNNDDQDMEPTHQGLVDYKV